MKFIRKLRCRLTHHDYVAIDVYSKGPECIGIVPKCPVGSVAPGNWVKVKMVCDRCGHATVDDLFAPIGSPLERYSR